MMHTYKRRVEFGDTDLAGIMHFSNFFRFMEAAECDFLRQRGMKVSWVEGNVKYGFPRVSVNCDYRSPAFYDDFLEIDVSLEMCGTKSVTYQFDFRRGETSLAVGRMTSVYVSAEAGQPMKAQEIPMEIRAKLTA